VTASGQYDATQSPILVDPTGTYAAVRHSNGSVNICRLSDGRVTPGTYMARNPVVWAWSSNRILALINASGGLTVWRPGSGVVSVPTRDNPCGHRLLWKPDGSGVLVLSTFLTGLGRAPSGGVVVDPGGHVQTFAPALPQGDLVLALMPGGKDFWYGPKGHIRGTHTMSEAPLP
jgi:hypothetical protein